MDKYFENIDEIDQLLQERMPNVTPDVPRLLTGYVILAEFKDGEDHTQMAVASKKLSDTQMIGMLEMVKHDIIRDRARMGGSDE